MPQLRRPHTHYFGIISGTLGLILCLGQSYKGHIDAEHEREKMQEMHEQKMHYLHEFHRQQLHARDHRIAAMEAEKRAVEAEKLAGMYSEKAGHVEKRGVGGEQDGSSGEQKDKEAEFWRLMDTAGVEGAVGRGIIEEGGGG